MMALNLYLYTSKPHLVGESQNGLHREWIELESFNWGETRSGARPGTSISGSSKPQFASLKIVKFVDTSSPQLMAACAKETQFSYWRIDVQRQSGDLVRCIYGLRLWDCMLSAVRTEVDNTYLAEELSLIFKRFEIDYVKLGPTGVIQGHVTRGYDLANDRTYEFEPFLSH